MFNLKNRLLDRNVLDEEFTEQDENELILEATCIILLEVAQSDDEFTSIEKATVSALLQKKFQMPQDAVDELIEIAGKKREKSVGLWEFTDLINKNYPREDKIKIIEAAWRVIYADADLNMYEDYFIHRLAKLLRLNHSEMINAKVKVLEEARQNDQNS